MILEFVINTVLTSLTAIFNLLPDLPDVPTWITSATQFLVDIAVIPVQIMSYVLTPSILIFVFTSFLLVTNYELVYKITMWILRKIPMLHIS